jgi:hypothetical protein
MIPRARARGATIVRRIVLDLPDDRLGTVAWERGFVGLQGGPWLPIVRTTPVLPRFRSLTLTYPVRFLQVDSGPGFSLARTVGRILGRNPEAWAAAAEFGETTAAALGAWLRERKWPTADVIHVSGLPRPESPCDLLSPAWPDDTRTLGGLSRVCDEWQTRLMVIRCPHARDYRDALALAQALVTRGGPAVLVTQGWLPRHFRDFYDRLVHDNPLDFTLALIRPRKNYALFAGAGREDGLRVSTPAVVLGRTMLRGISKDVVFPLGDATPPAWAQLKSVYARHALAGPSGPRRVPRGSARRRARGPRVSRPRLFDVERGVRASLQALRVGMARQYLFKDHESEGLIPVSKDLAALRRTLGIRRMVSLAEAMGPPTGPRFFNAALLQGTGERALREIDPSSARLRAGDTYHLSLQIGPKNVRLRVVGLTAIVEEVFKWSPEQTGTWVQFGVTGLDFDVLGHPVREVWLPRVGPTDPVTVPVVPRHPGVCVLRVCLYHRNNVVQSLKLAALVQATGARPARAAVRARRLAEALAIRPSQARAVSYLSRLEYSQASPEDAEACPPRTLSLVANDAGGQGVISVKTDHAFAVETAADLKDYVQAARDSMISAATPQQPPNDPLRWLYRFAAIEGPQNAGNPALYLDAMRKLAAAGRDLWGKIFKGETRTALGTTLGAGPATIHVAHMLLNATIPWAIIYDADFDDGRDGEPGVAYEACTAPLGDQGQLKEMPCGTDGSCPLSPERQAARKAGEKKPQRDTVICPLHFWGFRHLIEVPPRQVVRREPLPAPAPEIAAASPPRIVIGYHTGLKTAANHVAELRRVFAGPPVLGAAGDDITARWKLIEALRGDDVDLVYLFCHTRGGQYAAEKVKIPELALADGRIKPVQLHHTPPWSRRPLVVLNGCNTAGFSADAVSEFIEELVTNRGASGVLATEVPVFEPLASELGQTFLTEFLGGRPAGQALLEARRRLLAKLNPLGLIYTLYASADLVVRVPAAPASRARKVTLVPAER